MTRVGFVGAGKMAEAIVSSLLKTKTVAASRMFVSDIAETRQRALKRRYGVNTYGQNLRVVESARTVFLCVKPQELDAVLQEIAPAAGRDHLFISIAAGRRLRAIEAFLPESRIVRVMPNLATTVAEGMSVFCPGGRADKRDVDEVAKLLSCFGRVLQLPEERFDAVTALSGSGPAFLAYVMEAMVDGAVELGMTRDDALLLAEQTMLGTARVLIEQGTAPSDFINAVASPKGTTAAGLAVLKRSSVKRALKRTLAAAAERSVELSGGPTSAEPLP